GCHQPGTPGPCGVSRGMGWGTPRAAGTISRRAGRAGVTMTDKRLLLALSALALAAGCGGEAPDEGSVEGEVLEGTISDAMLPLDRVRPEAPLEDPDALAAAQEEADEARVQATEAIEEGQQAETDEPDDQALEDAPVDEPVEVETED